MNKLGESDEKIPFYIFVSPEIEEALADNETDLVELLRRESLDVSKGYAPDPHSEGGSLQRDPITVILASAALTVALGNAIVRVINALTNREVAIKELNPSAVLKTDTTVKFLGFEYTSKDH